MPSIMEREQQVRKQFLEEAQQYLLEVEQVLLGLGATGIIAGPLDQALRAIHSIKGGAAMMEYEALSATAHRLEDFLKILQARRPSVTVHLEGLLLQGVDTMRQIIVFNQQDIPVTEDWLEHHRQPVINQLQNSLGTLNAEDEATLFQRETGNEDLVRILFETEVEGCLQRLEGVLAQPDYPCLETELTILAQELAGLGDMLDLVDFAELCRAVTAHLEAGCDDLPSLARQSLAQWRTFQQKILAVAVLSPALADLAAPSLGLNINDLTLLESSQRQEFTDILFEEFALPEDKPKPALTEPQDRVAPKLDITTESSFKVSAHRFDELDNLNGELTISRNGLAVFLKRLRTQVMALGNRVRTLEQVNLRLRTAYDQEAIQPRGLALGSLLREGFDLLELDRYGDLHLLWQEVMETNVWIQELTSDLDLTLKDAEETAFDINRTARMFQKNLTQARMRPLTDLVERFPRVVRDLSVQFDKPVTLEIYGGSMLVDRTVFEALADPLLHLVRNAFDHGIESAATRRAQGKPTQGRIELRAIQRGSQTVITLSDDGGGLDFDRIRERARRMDIAPQLLLEHNLLELIFEPGFSTASQVTTLSGRGVGLDVVRTNLAKVRGTISVNTEAGVGTTFTLTLPLTLSVLRTLLVESQGLLMAIPTSSIEQMVLLSADNKIMHTAQGQIFVWEDQMVPLIQGEDWLDFGMRPPSPTDIEELPNLSAPALLILRQANDLACITIDRCWGEREVAVRPVEGLLSLPPGFGGSTILGDGQVVPLVSVPDLFTWASGRRALSPERTNLRPLTNVENTVLIVDDSIHVRRFLALSLEKNGYRTIEAKDGLEALEKLTAGIQVNAVVCDIEMPRLDGYGFLTQTRLDPSHKDLPILMLTSRSGEKHRQLAMQLGATEYFVKPFREIELFAALERLTRNLSPVV